VSEIVQYHLASRSFSNLYFSLQTGSYDAFPQADLVAALFQNESGLTDQEREALVEQLLIRTYEVGGVSSAGEAGEAGETARSVTTVVLRRFRALGEPSLRARLLTAASELDLPGTEAVVLQSAARMASVLEEDGSGRSSQGYEVEAMALAAVAPHYPSTALAELLRTIAAQSGDRRVVSATRNAARLILTSL